MSTIRDLADYYVARLASQYRLQTKAPAQVALFVKQMLADALALEINPAFDLETATGSQLDIIGKYVGVPRDVGVPDTRPYFGFITYDYPAGDQNLNGFTSYASISLNASATWLQYEFVGKAVSQLPDYSYRLLLKLKIGTNSSDNTMASIQRQIEEFFPGQLQLRDNKDMSLTYFYGSSFQLPLSVLTAALPRPMGVRVEAVEAIGFDVSVGGIPAFNSETPNPSVDLGDVQFSSLKSLLLTNAKASTFTVVAVTSSDPLFVIAAATPSLPAILGPSDTLAFDIAASSTEPVVNRTAIVSIYITSSAGLSRFDIAVRVSIEGVFLAWIAFDNFDGYADGPLDSPWDSWGWALAGSTTQFIPIWSRDNFDEYADGDLPAPSEGTDWAEAGSCTYFLNT